MCIDQISIMCNRHRSFHMAHNDGLRIGTARFSGSRIPYMTDRNIPLSELFDLTAVKYLRHQSEILMVGENAPVIDYNAAAFLPSVLKRIERHICHGGNVRCIRRDHAEHAAFFMQTCLQLQSFPSVPAIRTQLAVGLSYGTDGAFQRLKFQRRQLETPADLIPEQLSSLCVRVAVLVNMLQTCDAFIFINDLACDQFHLRSASGEVQIFTAVHNRRTGRTHMDFLRAVFIEKLNSFPHLCAPNNAVIHE